MELKDVLKKRYSMRTFQDIEVPDQKIEEILDLARLAPSSGNLQSFRVIVVKDSEVKKKLSAINAPVILVICAVPEEQARRYGDRGINLYSLQDATIFAAYCQLIIVDMGLASAWVGGFREGKVRGILGLPDSLRPIALLLLGYPVGEKFGRRKKKVKDIIYKNDLSILIPSRSEMFLARTIEDILANIEGNTEIIVVLDGYKPDPPLKADPRVTLIYHPESIGQRAATNEAARLSKAKYVMKCDAHCAFDKGFDIKMIAEMHDDWTMVPIMRNLHAFDWVCEDGHRRYQGPSGPCKECGKETTKDVVWIAKTNPQSKSYCFDSTPHFQYFGEYTKRPGVQGEITETMSLQGSSWMLTRDKYWELNVCDEAFGSWGSQGIEVAIKTWLSGGRVMCNQKTWYAHMFRTQGGDFGFPYPMSGKDQEHAKSYARDLFFGNKWDKQIRPLSWLVEKFWPVKGWTDEDLVRLKANTFEFSDQSLSTKPAESEPVEDKPLEDKLSKGIIYYTDNQLDEKIAGPVRDQLLRISEALEIPITSASLKKMDFGVKNIHFPSLKRGYLAMFKEIMAALEHSQAESVFFCEHDILYHPSHFDFTPPTKDKFYYNENVWKVDPETGRALHYDCKQVSGICVNRETALKHYRKRFELVSKNGFSMRMGFEPGTHRRKERVDDLTSGSWKSEFPNIDIRHGGNLSPTKWKKEQFRNQKFTKGWIEGDINNIPGWENLRELI